MINGEEKAWSAKKMKMKNLIKKNGPAPEPEGCRMKKCGCLAEAPYGSVHGLQTFLLRLGAGRDSARSSLKIKNVKT